jgi:site-specific DNA-methyltransferase (adenine-specific)
LIEAEKSHYQARLVRLDSPASVEAILDKTVWQDLREVLPHLPTQFVDLLFIDPPYNLSKSFNGRSFSQKSLAEYETWLESWLALLVKTLKPTASHKICGEWQSTAANQRVIIRNRITWEREKGRGAQTNWKNASEDIWFCTMSTRYTFNVEAVKLRRQVIAPYTEDGIPKDWEETELGRFRQHRPPDAKAGKVISQNYPGQFQSGRRCTRPVFGFGHNFCCRQKTGTALPGHRN